MPYTPVKAIDVLCWGHAVGAVAFDPNSGFYAFEYYPEFRNTGIELAPITLPLATTGPVVFPALAERTYHRLPAFVADALPDRFGNALIDAWMADQGIGRESVSPLDRLAYMGHRAMGALEFQPAIRTESSAPTVLEMRSLVEAARRALTVNFTGEASVEQREQLGNLISIGSSAGGARAKAVIGWNRATGEIVSGQFDVPEGFEHWIIKFDIDSSAGTPRQYGRVEYAYYLMACACGIRMEECRLLEAAGASHFMTRRFDRQNGQKTHMQTLCAMAELDFNMVAAFSSVQLFETALGLGLPLESLDELFDRMVFNICASNNDDHTKNWSFLLEEGGKWQLAPAYDLTYSFAPGNPWLSQHFMSVNGKYAEITRNDLLVLAERFSISNPAERIDSIASTVRDWPNFASEAGVSSARIREIGQAIEACCNRM